MKESVLRIIERQCKEGRYDMLKKYDLEKLFDIACCKGYINIVKSCEKIGHKPTHYNIFDSVANDQKEVAEYLTMNTRGPPSFKECLIRFPSCYSDKNTLKIIRFLVSSDLCSEDTKKDIIKCACRDGHLLVIKYLHSIGWDIINIENLTETCGFDPPSKRHRESLRYFILNGEKIGNMYSKWKKFFLKEKYYRKWRIIVLKRFICKVVLPLYYSPGFAGGEKEKTLTEKMFTV